MGKAPKPPDPKSTASAQTGTNVGTAIANSMLGNVNQVTPDGTLTYDQTGSHKWTDPYTGRTYTIPTFTATQTLSPEQQAIREQQIGAQTNLAGLANQQSGFLQNYLAEPFQYGNQDVEDWAYDLGSRRLDPRLAREEEALRTRLLNQGIREGSAAWNAEMGRHSQNANDAYTQLMLQGRGQAFQEALTNRNQPINEITALMSGSQVSQPNFVNTQQPQIPTTDVAGIIGDNYNQRLNAWGQNQAVLGGIMGAGATMLGAPSSSVFGKMIGLSDKRAKKDIKKRGEIDGMGIYDFRYKGSPEGSPKQTGLMAQEVEKKKPEAVHKKNGLRFVDYNAALGGK